MNSKAILFIFAIFTCSAAAMIWHVKTFQENETQNQALQNARVLSNSMLELRKLYSTEVIDTAAQHGLAVKRDYVNSESIPLPQTLITLFGKKLSKSLLESATFSFYSPLSLTTNSLDLEAKSFNNIAWEKLSQKTEKEFYTVDKTTQPEMLHFATAEPVVESCLTCHNNHSGASNKEWQVGDLASIITVQVPLTPQNAQASENLKITTIAYTIVLVCGFMGIILMIIKHKRFTDELERLTATDPLTGLYNQTELFTSLKRETEKVRRGAPSLCLISFNIDEFRNINSTFGHIRGDEILRHIGDILPEQLRAFDIPCRFTGDEFCVILPGCSIDDAHNICKRIIEKVQAKHPDIHLSMGIAQSTKDKMLDSNEIINQSHSKMEKAKNTNGSAIEI